MRPDYSTLGPHVLHACAGVRFTEVVCRCAVYRSRVPVCGLPKLCAGVLFTKAVCRCAVYQSHVLVYALILLI